MRRLLLTLPEAAAMIGVTTGQLQRLLTAGELEVVWLGSAQRVSSDAADGYLRRHPANPTADEQKPPASTIRDWASRSAP